MNRRRKDQTAFICYLIAIGAVAGDWLGLTLVCVVCAIVIDPPVRNL